MTFTALSSAWLFALLIPLIVFYFLKLKRPRQIVPSLVLWRQVLSDQRVNSPFQRFKRNLLLLLQILLLVLLVLAAMQPFLRRDAHSTARLPVLVDVSASMGALDKAGGRSRLDEAKQRLRERIEGMPADQETCLVAFSRAARKLTGFTNNKTELREALAALDVAAQLNAYGLAYLHVVDGLAFGFHEQGKPMALAEFRAEFRGPLIGNCGYTQQTAEEAIATGHADLIAFGRPYVSNPDLVERFTNGWELNPPADLKAWSAPTAEGYTDFPFHPRN